MPAQAGIQRRWIPAFAGMTPLEVRRHHNPSERPTISFMISLEPAQMRCTRALA